MDTINFPQRNISDVKFVLVPKNSDTIQIGKTYLCGLFNSASDKYLLFNRVVSTDTEQKFDFTYYCFVTIANIGSFCGTDKFYLLKKSVYKRRDHFIRFINSRY